jgi:hypothetical protein
MTLRPNIDAMGAAHFGKALSKLTKKPSKKTKAAIKRTFTKGDKAKADAQKKQAAQSKGKVEETPKPKKPETKVTNTSTKKTSTKKTSKKASTKEPVLKGRDATHARDADTGKPVKLKAADRKAVQSHYDKKEASKPSLAPAVNLDDLETFTPKTKKA